MHMTVITHSALAFEMLEGKKNVKIILLGGEYREKVKSFFFDEICSRVKRYSLATDFESISKYFGDKNGVVISTLHGVKGEEYTTVIAAGLLNGYLPHWDYIMNPTKKLCRRNETCKLLYVLCSRAKKNLYLFSECGRTTKSGSEYSPTDELSLIADII